MSTLSEKAKRILQIQKDRLDQEWVEHPSLYYEFAEAAATADAEMDRAKAAMELTEAELDKVIRIDPEAHGFRSNAKGEVKTTEPGIRAVILAHPKYRRAFEKYVSAKHEKDVLKAAVNALDHRKKALESLVSLHLAGYFATPRARGEEAREHVREVERGNTRRPLRREDQ